MAKKGRGRPRKRFRRNGQFQRREPAAVATPDEAPEQLDDSTFSPIEEDEEPPDYHDEDWDDEDAAAASGASQAALPFALKSRPSCQTIIYRWCGYVAYASGSSHVLPHPTLCERCSCGSLSMRRVCVRMYYVHVI
ncbi:unnamed protein product [Ectocarpus sp. 12 AP-2014]